MKVIEVVCKRWLLQEWVEGITLYPFIFYQGEPSTAIRNHEWIHIDQIRRDGVVKFYFNYLRKDLFNYGHGPYEKEAYMKQHLKRTKYET